MFIFMRQSPYGIFMMIGSNIQLKFHIYLIFIIYDFDFKKYIVDFNELYSI